MDQDNQKIELMKETFPGLSIERFVDQTLAQMKDTFPGILQTAPCPLLLHSSSSTTSFILLPSCASNHYHSTNLLFRKLSALATSSTSRLIQIPIWKTLHLIPLHETWLTIMHKSPHCVVELKEEQRILTLDYIANGLHVER